jgi:DNA-binding beta-propeller fold protein YncE
MPPAAAVALLLAGPALAGCGSGALGELPPAAEPARSPALAERPARRVVPVGPAPEGVAVDPVSHRVAVALREPGRGAATLALVDGRTGRVARRVALPGAPRHVALVRPGGPFVVPAEPADRVLLVRPGGAVALDVGTGRYPHDATAAGGRIFVGDERGDATTVLEGARRVATLRGAIQPGALAAARGGRAVAVVSVRERAVELYDARTLRRLGRAPAGVGPTHAVSDERERLYVTDTAGDALLVFALRPKLALVRRVYLPGSPYGIALDSARRRLWVTLTARNEVVELPAHGRPHPLSRLAAVRQPDSVAVDPVTGRVFVTGRDAGVLQLLDPPR